MRMIFKSLRIIVVSTLAAVVSVSVLAGPNVTFHNLDVLPGKQATVVDGARKFMSSKTGQQFKGSMHLNRVAFNGKSPATHTLVVLQNSRKAAAEWSETLADSQDFRDWMATLRASSQPVSSTNMDMVKSWGTIDNADRYWDVNYFSTNDPAGVVAAMDQLMKSDRFQDFPGQVWLNATAFGGDMVHGYTTHMFAVGYQSMAEYESWNDANRSSAEFQVFIKALNDEVSWLNSELVYNVLVFDSQTSLESFGE
jgi:hypothetical protein